MWVVGTGGPVAMLDRRGTELAPHLEPLEPPTSLSQPSRSGPRPVDTGGIIAPPWRKTRLLGDFEITGDVHGCTTKLVALLESRGYAVNDWRAYWLPTASRAAQSWWSGHDTSTNNAVDAGGWGALSGSLTLTTEKYDSDSEAPLR